MAVAFSTESQLTTQRYVYPLVAPPTPERLEQDKQSIEEQFDKAFSLVEQLAKDTEALKDAEKQRTEKLDSAMADLESVMADLKSANRRREDDAQRIRDEVTALKEAIPKAMDNQKTLTDNRLSEINTELTSLKTLVSQRMAPAPSGARARTPAVETVPDAATPSPAPAATSTPAATPAEPPKNLAQNSFSRPSSGSSTTKASIPAWQMAAAKSATDGEGSKEASS